MSEPIVNQRIEMLKVNKFFITALEDENLLNQLEAALSANDYTAIINLATEQGYNFSPESLRLGLNNIANLVAPVALLEQE